MVAVVLDSAGNDYGSSDGDCDEDYGGAGDGGDDDGAYDGDDADV